jgi:Kef-type K+ transport system membrane component KefB
MYFIDDMLAASPFEFSTLLFIGSAVALGFLLGKATHWVKLTAIVGYIVAGVIIGPVLGIVELSSEMNSFIVNFTLAFVAFIIGLGFTQRFIKRTGKVVGVVTLIQSLLTFLVVAVGVFIVAWFLPGYDFKMAVGLAVIFGVLGLATAPAGTIATLHECRARGSLNRITMGIVGLDDALAVLVFVIGLAAVQVFMGAEVSGSLIFESVFIEILGAIALGVLVGVALAYVFGFFKEREEMFIVSVGAVLLCAGLAEILGASVIMSCMVLGMVFVNLRPREGKVIHSAIEGLIPVVFIVFFVTAGLDIASGLDLKRTVILGLSVLPFLWAMSSWVLREERNWAYWR